MKRLINKPLVSAALIVCLLTLALSGAGAGAAEPSLDGMRVFASMTYKDADILMDGTDVTLTVPWSYEAAEVDISAINTTTDPAVFNLLRSYELEYIPGPLVAIDEKAVMRVNYKLKSDPAATPHFTDYTVTVRLGLKPLVQAQFAGTIEKRVTIPTTSLSFFAGDFSNYYVQNDSPALTAVTISGSGGVAGSLQYNGAAYTPDTPIPLENLSLLKFIPNTTGTNVYTVYAHNDPNPSISNRIGNCTLNVYVTGGTRYLDEISYRMSWNNHLFFDENDFIAAYRKLTGNSNLNYVVFATPSSTYGRLYYNYTSSGNFDFQLNNTDRMFVSSSPHISNVAFVPRTDYDGTVSVYYTAYGPDGVAYEGSVRIVVEYNGAYSSGSYNGINNAYSASNTVTYSTERNEPIFLSDLDFQAMLVASTGYNLSYVRFHTLPSSGLGRLQYNSNASTLTGNVYVTTETRYYRNAIPTISNISFIPYTNYSGIVNIPYTAYTVNGAAYGGTLYIRVGLATSSSTALDDVTYSARQGGNVTLDAADIQAALSKATNSTLSYITFTGLPSGGSLYYGYRAADDYASEVSTSVRYYRSSSMGVISQITFVPKPGYSGSATIPYSAYSLGGGVYSGKIVITLASAGKLRSLSYDVIDGEVMDFGEFGVDDDIRALVRSRAGASPGEAFSHAVFEVPDRELSGILYSYYPTSVTKRVQAEEGEVFSYDEPPRISELTFVPAYDAAYEAAEDAEYDSDDRGVDGGAGDIRFELAYTAYTASGRAFEGTISITALTLPYGWAREEVASLAGRGVVPGRLLEDYEADITRAEFTALLVNTYDYSGVSGGRSDDERNAEFTDLRGNPYATLVRRAYELGLVDGDGGSQLFNPDAELTREQAAKILCATIAKITDANIGAPNTDASAAAEQPALAFTDAAEISDWAVPYVAYANEHGIMLGRDDGGFAPRDYLTREEAMALVERAVTEYRI